jgi:ribosomal protein L37E
MVKLVKVTEETHEDLQAIQQCIIDYGIKSLPNEFDSIIESLKDKSSTYKTIIAIAVKFLRNVVEQTKPTQGRKEAGQKHEILEGTLEAKCPHCGKISEHLSGMTCSHCGQIF